MGEKYVSGGNVTPRIEPAKYTLKRIIPAFGLAALASVILTVGRLLREETLANLLPATETAHTYSSGTSGNLLLSIAFIPFPLIAIALLVFALCIIRPSIIRLFKLNQTRRMMIILLSVFSLVFSVITTTSSLNQTGSIKAYNWLYDHNIQVDNLTLPTSGQGTISVATTKNAKTTLAYKIDANNINLTLP